MNLPLTKDTKMQKIPKFPWPSGNSDSGEYKKCCEFLLDHLAEQDDSKWSQARQTLINRYALPAQLIDKLHDTGDIYAIESDIVFVHRIASTGNIAGASLQSLSTACWKTIGDEHTAWFATGDLSQARYVSAVVNPIEALSYHTIDPNETAISYPSLAVSCPSLLALRELMLILQDNQGFTLAFCESKIGVAAEVVQRSSRYAPFIRRPAFSKSWNEKLQFLRTRTA
ncbi:MAG: hypothetical protein C5B47_07990 [Verrucomicrobia bacterium]|nr:MAG: hypothetical protein C5B47_07990 [Verrucomicrobiota bacterium]